MTSVADPSAALAPPAGEAKSPISGAVAGDDAQLKVWWEAARQGDERALSALCKALRPRLFRVAFSVLKSSDDADDVAQAALVKIVTKRFVLFGVQSVSAFATTTALNLAKNRRRDHKRRGEIVNDAAQSDLVARGARAADAKSAFDVVDERATRARLHAAVAALPERQRDVVELRAIAGLEFKEVGRLLSISEANARMAFSLAKKKLEAALADASAERSAATIPALEVNP